MEIDETVLRGCLLFEFHLQHSAAEAQRRLCQAFGEGVLSRRTCSRWFKQFRSGDYNLVEDVRSGRPSTFDNDELRQLVESDPRLTTREMSSILGCTHTTIERHLTEIGKVSKLGSWVPHALSQRELGQRSDTCTVLLSQRRTFAWLDNILTGDEKWVMYVNIIRKRQWVDPTEQPEPEPKPELHPRKIMLSVWWDVQGIVLFELLPANTSITASYYCSQLERLSTKLEAVRPRREKVLFLHDNARPHIARMTRLKLVSLGWELLPHPPYSPDIAPSDYHLFRSLQSHLKGKSFEDEDHIYTTLDTFFNSLPRSFFEQGIHVLPQRWRRVVENEGGYIVD